jgi:hypothetical protein
MKRRDLLLLGGAMSVVRDLRTQQKTMPVIGFPRAIAACRVSRSPCFACVHG